VVTTAADGMVAAVHNRMPVVLHARSIDAWLDPGMTDPTEVSALLSANLPPVLLAHAVGSEVNNARNDGPALIVPVGPSGHDTGGHDAGGHDTGAERRLL
jgi:putative SOS response-associated peptidase YedK